MRQPPWRWMVLGAIAIVGIVCAVRAFPRPPAGDHADEAWSPLPRVVTIEVMNAGGAPGAARDAALRLRRAGLDVVWWGNAPPELVDRGAVTIRVYARRGDTTGAGRVGEVLGATQVRQEPDPTRLVDLTVILP